VKFKRSLESGQKVRVLVVDDSAVVRRLITLALEAGGNIEVVGTASNGIQALERTAKLSPDVVTLDIAMPQMNGLDALRRIRAQFPQTRVVMLSSLTESGAAITLEALAIGADDYVTKPSASGSVDESIAGLSAELDPKIRQFFFFQPAVAERSGTSERNSEPLLPKVVPDNTKRRPQVVGIGVSTGGPAALGQILPQFPSDFALPILIVQHMPRTFTRLLCERLSEVSALPVREATNGDSIAAGKILIAPGDFHMRVVAAPGSSDCRISLDQSPPENSCRPAVDPLFESLACVFGGEVIAAILTGMGHDGLRGARILRSRGAVVLAQDEASSTVWGMPRAIVEAGLANAVLPLNEIIPGIVRASIRPWTNDQKGFREAS
jgi:two-component system chemotaxis response regulator CheB